MAKNITDKLNDFIDEYVPLEDYELYYTFKYVDENGYRNNYDFVYRANLCKDNMETEIKIYLIKLINDKKLNARDLTINPCVVLEEISNFLLPIYEAAAFIKCSNQNYNLEFIEESEN